MTLVAARRIDPAGWRVPRSRADEASIGVLVLERPPATDPGDRSDATPAVDRRGREWLFVEHVANPDGTDLYIGFEEGFAAASDERIDQAVDFLLTLSGVRSAIRHDPAEILLVGTRDARRIRDALVDWWTHRLG